MLALTDEPRNCGCGHGVGVGVTDMKVNWRLEEAAVTASEAG